MASTVMQWLSLSILLLYVAVLLDVVPCRTVLSCCKLKQTYAERSMHVARWADTRNVSWLFRKLKNDKDCDTERCVTGIQGLGMHSSSGFSVLLCPRVKKHGPSTMPIHAQ